jgi:hypothetical protein
MAGGADQMGGRGLRADVLSGVWLVCALCLSAVQ